MFSIVNATFERVFAEMIKRDVSGKNRKLYEALLRDVNQNNIGMDEFMKTSAQYGRVNGWNAIVMDNNDKEKEEISETEAIKNRDYPYLYFRKPDSICVEKTEREKSGKIKSIVFREGTWIDEADKNKKYDLFKLWGR